MGLRYGKEKGEPNGRHIDPTEFSLPLPQAAKMELTIPTVYANTFSD